MPDIITHYRFGVSVTQRLVPELCASLRHELYDSATAGPDLWFSYRFWRPKAQQGKPERGNIMQHEHTGAFLSALLDASRQGEAKADFFSYLAGFLCHYCLDKAAHPYIIYRSGLYDGTEATLSCRGDHMRMEHALDLLAVKAWGLRPWQRPITRRILRLRAMPPDMRPELDAIYERVYGWSGAWNDLNLALRDQRLFYRLAEDPTGLLDAILRRVDNGASGRDLTSISYHGKEQPQLDIANEAKQPWQHPRDPRLISRESFAELSERAANETAELISLAWAYASGRTTTPPSFGNLSYETGFDCADPKNDASAQCDPLRFDKHQRTKG